MKQIEAEEIARTNYENEYKRLKAEIEKVAEKTLGLLTQAKDVGGIVRLYDQFASKHFTKLEARTEFLKKISVQLESNEAESATDLYQAAMYRSKAASVQDFIEQVNTDSSDSNKPFFYLGGIKRNEENLSGAEIELGFHQVRHIQNKHPDFNDWEGIKNTIENGEAAYVGKNMVTGGDSYVFTIKDGAKTFVAVGAPVEASKRKNKPRRIVVLTAFKDSPARVEKWLADKKESTLSQSARGLPHNPRSDGTKPSDPKSGSNNKITKKRKGVNAGGGIDVFGTVKISADKSIINLFKNANLSTLIHETGHIFEAELRRLVESGLAGEYLSRNLGHDYIHQNKFKNTAEKIFNKLQMSHARNESRFLAAMRQARRWRYQ